MEVESNVSTNDRSSSSGPITSNKENLEDLNRMNVEGDMKTPLPASKSAKGVPISSFTAKEESLVDLQSGGINSWKRPDLPTVNPRTDSIDFQNTDVDYYESSSRTGSKEPVIRMYGVTMGGNSVLAHITGFDPYFYVAAWEGFDPSSNDLQLFKKALNDALMAENRHRGIKHFIKKVECVQKRSLWQYQFQKPRPFLKITTAIPALVAAGRRLLERGLRIGNIGSMAFSPAYEANFQFILRYMVDKDIISGGWCRLQAGKYKVRPARAKMSRCQLEVDVDAKDLMPHPAEGEWQKIAPIRILSFDIECSSRENKFPEAEIDPVIQIANAVQVLGEKKPFVKNVFTLKGCAPIPGAEVIPSEKEANMLVKWKRFIEAVDPDIITGYNICNFDIKYILDRATALKAEEVAYLGRIKGSKSTMRESTFSSKQYGKRENTETTILGVVQFDAIKIIRRDFKLTSYSLNNVSAHFLGQQKEDVHYSIITDLQNGTDVTRRRLAVYCLKDAYLPLLLLEKLMLLVNHIEMARVTGVTLTYLVTRGQQIKVLSQLYRKAKGKGFVVPVRPRHNTDDKFEGATVIEPKKAYYRDPIATLDFASLYPSIMMAHNLCYTTYIARHEVKNVPAHMYERTPLGHCFIKKEVQEGLLPEVLRELLAARKLAKKAMKKETDPFKKAVLNGRQLALKISANSVYGFTGAQVGQLPCLEISSGVTAYGRKMIDETKRLVEEKYTMANGYKHNAEVVYGDTDSVMIKFGVDTVAESMKLGEEAATEITKHFTPPIRLEFEKVYYPYLLMNKKRYAGLYWTNPVKWDKMDCKGIETVRRDNCQLVRTVVDECLHRLLVKKDQNSAVNYVKRIVSDLLCNRVDLSMLVISKALSKTDYAGKQAHVELAKKMSKRDAASAPKLGDRVAYVITQGCKGAKNFEKAEDPIYVLEHNLSIDYSYYLDNQLKLPLTRIFEPVIGKVSMLFQGEHTRKIKLGRAMSGGMMKFAVKTEKCLNCNVPLKRGRRTICVHCEHLLPVLYNKKLSIARKKEKLFNKLWTQCQRCSGSLHQDVLCSNKDCPIFYRRTKVQKDLKEAHSILDKFDF